ncbi:hypothetical protein [Piscinibacter sp. XHJ-5]|uniref:hypothetical protein n=1 Tax=Piscinibacter sp. XHJ-5 TaxID=3037797 RepID=UPI002452D71D|nr:hypothetical protein [Piscinibacter sp. XHJ-5]
MIALDLVAAPPGDPLPPIGSARTAALRRLRALTHQRNIVGVGISEKTTDDETTGELSLCFYVRRKTPLSKVRGDMVVPPFVCVWGDRSYLTDVKEIGPCRLHHSAVTGLRSGASVSHAATAAGTIGAIVQRNGMPCILSNAHVLARSGKARLGDPILAPGTTDGGKLSTDLVARLVAFAPLDGFGENLVDAAVAEILPDKARSIRFDIPGVSAPRRIGKVRRGMQVMKTGKATQQTEAHVIDEHFRTLLPYPGLGLVRFVDQILCTSFADPGDSGALVVDTASGHVVGLHFSGNDQVSICNPIGPVLQALGISFAL